MWLNSVLIFFKNTAKALTQCNGILSLTRTNSATNMYNNVIEMTPGKPSDDRRALAKDFKNAEKHLKTTQPHLFPSS